MQRWLLGALAVIATASAHAAVDANEIARLDHDLTPMGAERAGDGGAIPAWEGGITAPPAGYTVGRFHPDPYADDERLFTITPENYRDHTAHLTEGQQALFAKYPSYRIHVYPTRRSASLPDRLYTQTAQNAAQCTLTKDGEGVEHCAEGLPFPILSGDEREQGYQAIWNHKLKYKGITIRRWANQAAPTASGAYTLVRMHESILGLYYKPGNTSDNTNNVFVYFFQEVQGPARLAGNVLLVHETLNQIELPRQAWVYNPGQRRVRRAPDVAYDNPGTASDGLRTNDMTDMFNGAMDRFDWKLVGKRAIYVPYNAYEAHSDRLKVADLVKPGHLNPEHIRYELHRMWVVEATLRPGKRHLNARRTFYLDEDSWTIMEIDHYDSRGRLWRVSEAPSIVFYDLPAFQSTLEVHYDLQSGRYIAGLLDNEETVPDFTTAMSPDDFSPQSLRRRGVR